MRMVLKLVDLSRIVSLFFPLFDFFHPAFGISR